MYIGLLIYLALMALLAGGAACFLLWGYELYEKYIFVKLDTWKFERSIGWKK